MQPRQAGRDVKAFAILFYSIKKKNTVIKKYCKTRRAWP
jgi:hypothetical protein